LQMLVSFSSIKSETTSKANSLQSYLLVFTSYKLQFWNLAFYKLCSLNHRANAYSG
jgi:hypothetical protein